MKAWKILPLLVAGVLPSAFAANLTVPAGGDLQGALNSAQPGDTIQIAAGAQFVGHYFLPANPGTQTITIQSTAISSLPSGTRVGPSQANLMPKIITPDGAPALQMTTGAAYYRIQGIEFLPAAGVYVQDLIQVGNGGETSVGALPHDIDFDRNYIHGDAGAGSKRGIALNGATITVENSYFTDFKSTWQDTQAICGWNGPGPFRIVNNELEGGSETVAFGGATPAIAGVLPSDIVIQGNHFSKPLSWRPGSSTYAGMAVWAKNHIELKFAQRVTIDGNTFENNWVGADQRGFAMVFNVRAETGSVPWAVVNNVSVTNNVIRHSAAGIVFVGHDGASNEGGSAGAFLVQNNVFEDITGDWGGDGRLFQIQDGVNGITFDHNTAFQAGYLLVFDSGPSYNINFTNNISNIGWGIAGNGSGGAITTLLSYVLGGVFLDNALIGGSQNGNPLSNFFPASIDAVGFIDYANENFLLSASSPYKNAGTDGQDLGATVQTSAVTTPAPAPTPTAPAPTAPAPTAPAPTAPAPTAPSPGSSIPSGWVQLISKATGSCLDVIAVNGSQYNVTPLQQYQCWGGDNQLFQFVPVDGGYKINSKVSGMQLDVSGGVQTNGAAIIQYPFWGGANEIFTLVDDGSGAYTIRPNHSGKCIDIAGASNGNGAPVVQWSCNGRSNQSFQLVPLQ